MGRFAVIDTETNWQNLVMSIGTVIADTETFALIDGKYHVLDPEYTIGGMYEKVLFPNTGLPHLLCSRQETLTDLCRWLKQHGVTAVFAYNAAFDRNHLPELGGFTWYDIMRLAAYRQHNPKIPPYADCCSTGRLKRNYGVEPMMQLLSGDGTYHETHNAFYDALDELEIMRLLDHSLSDYIPL